MADVLPSFARIEIALQSPRDLTVAATDLRALAGQLDDIAGTASTPNDALVLAHHRIKGVSQKLRSGAK
jgi:hypothetical protein